MVTSVSASPACHSTLSRMIIPVVSVALNKRSAHMAQVDPRCVVTCVVFWGEPQIFTIDFEGADPAHEPF